MEHTHTNKIVYIAIGVVGVIILIFIMKHFMRTVPGGTPPESERTLEEQMTATGPSTITPEERQALEKEMTATGPSTITAKERAELKKAMTPQ